MQKGSALAILSLFIALMIDGLGQGILFPLLTKTLVVPTSTDLITHGSPELRTLLYGTILGLYFLCWFFGAVYMGNMSDGAGRKKALLICMLGDAVSYLVTALGFVLHSLLLIYLSRIIAGLTAGSQPIAQAAIIDMSTPEQKTRNIAYIMLCVCTGIILGPLLGSFLTDHSLINWFSNTTPLYFAALLATFNLFLIWSTYQEKSDSRKKVNLKLTAALSLVIDACKHKGIRHMAFVYFLFQTGWIAFYMYNSVYLVKEYHFTINQSGLFLALVGIGLGLGFTLVVPLLKKFDPKIVIICGYSLLGCVALIITLVHMEILAWLLVIPGTAGTAVGISYAISTFSSMVSPEKQGWVMGVGTSVAVLAGTFSVFMVGIIARISVHVPMIASFVFMVLGVIVSLFYKIKDQQLSNVIEDADLTN